MAFPGPGAHVYYNEAGEPTGWDYPSDDDDDPFDDRDADYPEDDPDDFDDEDDDVIEHGDPRKYNSEFGAQGSLIPIKCGSCGGVFKTARVTPDLRCGCGSDNLDLHEAAFEDPQSLRTAAEEAMRKASPQAWRRIRNAIGQGESGDLAEDIASIAGGDPKLIEQALVSYDWDHAKQGSLSFAARQHLANDADPLECLDAHKGGCHGPVEYRMPLSGTGKSFPRCDKHWDDRLDEQDRINERYPDSPIAPSDFDPSYAGETWDDDDGYYGSRKTAALGDGPGYYILVGNNAVAGPYPGPGEAHADLVSYRGNAVEYRSNVQPPTVSASPFMNPSGYGSADPLGAFPGSMGLPQPGLPANFSGDKPLLGSRQAMLDQKVVEIYNGIIATNPGVSAEYATKIARRTVERYPNIVQSGLVRY